MAIILLPPQTPPVFPPDCPQPVDWPPPPVEEEDGFDCGVPGGLVFMSRIFVFPSFPFCPGDWWKRLKIKMLYKKAISI